MKSEIKNPVAYILCYTLRTKVDVESGQLKASHTTTENGYIQTDHWEVFAELDATGNTPQVQAEARLVQIESVADSNDTTELYTWNIAAITRSNEWYETQPASFPVSALSFANKEAAMDKWDDIEVQPVIEGDGFCEVCEEGQESFWSVYLHQANTAGVQCIADLPTKELAF